MRIRSLHLTRYGKFTDKTLNFGVRAPGTPDFHLVYGPNEAGKSTLLSAWLDLIYGMPARTPYNFIHAYDNMRIGAELELSAGIRSLWRIKKPSQSLLDDNSIPVGDTLLAAETGGLERAAYATMFSLDDATIETGGEDILKSKGDLGQLLFSASAGLSDLSSQLETLSEKAAAFHKPKVKTSELLTLKHQLEELKKERERIDVAASQHAHLVRDQAEAKAAFEAANGERGAKRLRLETLQRLIAMLPQLARHRELSEERRELADLPDAPADWPSLVPELRKSDITFAAAIQRIDTEIAGLERRIAETAIDPSMQAQTAGMTELEALSARALTARRDLPNRQDELRSAEASIRLRLVRLGRPGETDPMGLLLPAPVTGRIRSLITSQSGLAVRKAQAEQELAKARQSLAELERSLAADGALAPRVADAVLDQLSALLAEIRSVDPIGRLERAEQELAQTEAIWSQRHAALAPFAGSAEEVLALPVPDAPVIADWAGKLKAARDTSSRDQDLVDRLVSEHAILVAERDAIGATPGLVGDEQAEALQAQRDAAWQTHLAALDLETAKAFEAVLAENDAAQAARLAQATDVARFRALTRDLAIKTEELAQARLAAQKSATRLGDLTTGFANLVRLISPRLDPAMDVEGFERWLTRLDLARQAANAKAQAVRGVTSARDAIIRLEGELAEALAAAGTPGPHGGLKTMVLKAGQVVEAARQRVQSDRQIGERTEQVRQREHAMTEARLALESWQADWREALSGTWLSDLPLSTARETVEEILIDLAELGPALNNRDGLADRIAKMERDLADFARAATAIWQAVSPEPVPDEPARAYQMLVERQARARDADKDVGAARDTLLARRQERTDAQAALETTRRQIADMAARFGVSSLDEVEIALANLAVRRRIDGELASLSMALKDGTRQADLHDAIAQLSAVDRDEAEAEIARLKPECDALDARCQQLFATFKEADDRLAALRGDDQVARLEEERRTVLLAIEEGARNWLKLRLGALATEKALRLYREHHRSSMMNRASDAFRDITNGRYTGLATQSEGQSERLIAVEANGASKTADALSKGTRFQLYLALRIAGYHDIAANRDIVPFVADDIMETFDDTRSAATLSLFSGMAEKGQVIYLTHHRHLVEMARETCPGITIHDLNDGS